MSLGRDVSTGEPVRLGVAERRQGLYVIGKTGTGKTTLLEHLILQDIDGGLGVCVLDPHGDLIDSVVAQIPSEREGDVVLLDLADSRFPFGLNLFECGDRSDRNLVSRVATQAVQVFEKLWGGSSWGPQLAQVLRNCSYTLIENPGYTLADLRRLLLDSAFRARLVANVTNPQVVEFWELEYNPMRPQDQQQIVRSTLNKVDEFLTPTVYPIVGYGRTTIDFRSVMDEGRIVLVRLSLGEVGGDAVSLIGSMLVGQMFNAALSRQDLPPAERRQFNLYADEYHRFATPAFAELLAEARKYAVATTLAHQWRSQLTDEANRSATLNAANLVVFAVHGEDGQELAKQFDRTPPPPAVAGQKAKLTISQDPIGHLLRAGHENARVRWLAQRRLAMWVQTAKADVVGEEADVPRFRGDGDAARSFVSRALVDTRVIQAGLTFLNRYLVESMESRIAFGSEQEAELLIRVAVRLRGLMDFAAGQDVWTMLRGPVRETEPWEKENFAGVFFRLYIRGFVQYPDDPSTAESRVRLIVERNGVEGEAHADNDGESIGEYEVGRLEFHLRWIRELGAALAASPILVDSGQWEPYYDKPRSYADVEGEIASSLVSLPKYEARCRVLEGRSSAEHVVHTPEFRPAALTSEAELMVLRIRQHTRDHYCAPLEDVLQRIRERQKAGGDGGQVTKRSVSLG